MKLCLSNFLDYNYFMQLCNLCICLHSCGKNSQKQHPGKQNRNAGQDTVGEDLVSKHLSVLKEFKSPGPEGLHSRILKLQTDVISELLNEIFRSL